MELAKQKAKQWTKIVVEGGGLRRLSADVGVEFGSHREVRLEVPKGEGRSRDRTRDVVDRRGGRGVDVAQRGA